MAKKKSKLENTKTENLVNDNTSSANISVINEKTILNEEGRLSSLSIVELMSLQQACALVCKRFETIAQLDPSNNSRFKEYQRYYEMIFLEIKERIAGYCS